MILARCPACSTTFRVRPEQLNARQGRVRCGQCNHAFNALESVVDESLPVDEAPAPAPPPAISGAPLFVLEEKRPEGNTPPWQIPVSAYDTWSPGPRATPPAEPEEIELAIEPEPEPEPASFPLETEHEPEPEPAFAPFPADDARIEPTGEISSAPLQEWPPMEADADDFAAPPVEFPRLDEAGESAPDAADLPIPPQPPAHVEPPVAEIHADGPVDFDALIHTRDAAVPLLAPLPRPQRSEAAPPPVEEEPLTESGQPALDNDETAAPPALRQAAWAAGATLLVLALLAQTVLVFRNDIAQSSPQMRPFMESVCAGLGCELPLPRDPAEIAIESSDIQPDAGREAFFTLHATLRNRADFQQAWPHLEITLTDARDKALVRRVLEPAQWLPADAPKDAFPAHREVVTRVGFEAPGVAAAGYRVYAFYP